MNVSLVGEVLHSLRRWKFSPGPLSAALSMPLGLVSTQAPQISCSTRSSKLPIIQKAAAVVMIIVWGMAGGTYAWDKINIQANAQQKEGGEGYFWKLTVHVLLFIYTLTRVVGGKSGSRGICHSHIFCPWTSLLLICSYIPYYWVYLLLTYTLLNKSLHHEIRSDTSSIAQCTSFFQ